MITFSRKLAQQLRAVMRRAFGGRGVGPAVCFAQDLDGLRVRASRDSVAVEYRDPGPLSATADTLWLPFQALEHFAAKSDDLVALEASGHDRVTAQWRDKSVPQLVQYDGQPANTPLPERPDRFVTNPPRLLRALQDAADTCDPDSARFTLGCIQMKPDGSIWATDGGQLLVQRGFSFPWAENLLVPRCRAFNSGELPRNEDVAIGKTDDSVAIACGRWTFYLLINQDGRFPQVEQLVRSPDQAVTKCRLAAADAHFLA